MAPEWLTNSLRKVTGLSDPGPNFIQKTNAGNAAMKRGRPDEAEPFFKDAAMNNLAMAYRAGQVRRSRESLPQGDGDPGERAREEPSQPREHDGSITAPTGQEVNLWNE